MRHSGESRNPEAASTAHVSLDTGFRRYDEGCPLGRHEALTFAHSKKESPADRDDGPGSMLLTLTTYRKRD